MFDWDDLKIFLAISREGSVRAAARSLGTTHATVSRRLKILEGKLDAPLFEKGIDGAELSELGHTILASAEEVEKSVSRIDRVAFAKETSLAGSIRLTISEDLYSCVLAEDLAIFQTQNPQIELEITASNQMSNLARRETDLAIRITKAPPHGAFGRKIADSPLAIFTSLGYLENRPSLDRWITLDYKGASKPLTPGNIVGHSNSARVAQHMIRNGTGIGLLPCFMGDSDPELVRMPRTAPLPDNEIWALVHSDIRKNPRVRALLNYIYEIFKTHRPLIEGDCPRDVQDNGPSQPKKEPHVLPL
ncbi:MAG: LysR family transcriptional regulator [Sneathiella sp.]|nr:LysR family transcriptional regulator [Sneathiella sp.]